MPPKLHKIFLVQRRSVVPLDHKDLVFDISQFFALAGAQILQLLGLAPDLVVAGGPDDAAGFVGEFLGGAPIWSQW